MLRAVSLAARTGFGIKKNLIEAIKANAKLIVRVPPDAIRKEFNTILMSDNPSKYLKLLNRTGLLEIIAPEIYSCVRVRQDKRYHKHTVFNHLIYTCDHCPKDLTIRLAGLLHDIGKPSTRRLVKGTDGKVKTTFHKHEMASNKLAQAFLKRMRYSNDMCKAVLKLVKNHMYHYTREWTDGAVRKFIKKMEMDDTYMHEDKISEFPLFQLRAAERLGSGRKPIAITERQRDFERRIIEVYRAGKDLEVKDLEINGYVVMKVFNLGPGKLVGDTLKHLLEHVLEKPELNNRERLLELACHFIATKVLDN
jgi:tRNA nucleotidyltransferase (CCA-adding enzyme)